MTPGKRRTMSPRAVRILRWVTRAVAVLIWLGVLNFLVEGWSRYCSPEVHDWLAYSGYMAVSESGRLWLVHCSLAQGLTMIALALGGCLIARRSARWLVWLLGYAALPLVATGPPLVVYVARVGSWPDLDIWASAWGVGLLVYGAAYLWALPWEKIREALEGPYEEDDEHQDGAIERRQDSEPDRDRV